MPDENLKIIQSYSEGGANATDAAIAKDTQTNNVEKIKSTPRRKAVDRPMRTNCYDAA